MTAPSARTDLQGTQWQPRAQDEHLFVRDEPLQPGEVLGRYVVLYRLGAGGMGVVYAAYDPELDRKLALKLLRRGSSDPERRKRAQERLLAEARAMARLNHPHVITVHDVAIFEGRVFVAMEFVDGTSLTAALAAKRRSWKEILELLIPAGRGLAAAHDAGLVHRDFKPDNVMVSKTARVLVTDFGLARALEPEIDSSRRRVEAPSDGAGTGTLDSDSHSSVGPEHAPSRFAGTPAYMAPEQRAGQAIDARSDQFSFCVTLYEALYGERPFGGDDAKSLQQAILNRVVRPPPQHSKVPQWLRAVLLRGLSARPEERWPSMHRLLQALSCDPRARWRRGSHWALGVSSVGALGVGLHLLNGAAATPCAYGEQRAEGLWNGSSRDAGRSSFLQTRLPYAESSWQVVSGEIDDYVQQWTAAHREVCEATHVRQEQSDALFDLRMNCLERRFDELDTLIEVMKAADPELVKTATGATSSLIPIAVCNDLERLSTPLPLPDDPAAQQAIRAVRTALSRAKVYGDARQFGPGLELAAAQLDKARELEYLPLLAEALFANGSLARGTGKVSQAQSLLREAVEVGARGHHDVVVAEALLELIVTLRLHHESWDRADELTHIARAAVARAGDPLDLRVKLAQAEGALAMQRERVEEARAHFEEALELARQSHPPDESRLAQALNNVAVVSLVQRDLATADRYLHQALGIYERRLGAEHPVAAHLRMNLAFVKIRLGELGQAQDLLQVALRIAERNMSGDPSLMPTAVAGLGSLAYYRLEYQAAAEHLRESSASLADKEDAPALLSSNLAMLAQILIDQGQPGEALDLAKRAEKVAFDALGNGHFVHAAALCTLGAAYLASNAPEEAVETLERALPGLRDPVDYFASARCRTSLATAVIATDKERAGSLLAVARRELESVEQTIPLREAILRDVARLEARLPNNG